MMTTGQLRQAARDAAKTCHWQEAADLQREAINRYPVDQLRYAHVQHDIARMREVLASYEYAAKQFAR